jgi:hypothetical protein
MMPEVVGGIVRGAYHFDAKFLEDGVGGQTIRQQGVRALPDRERGFPIQQLGNAKVALQFEVRPVIERIAQGVRNGSRPGQKFFVGRGIACDVFLGNAVGPHGPPFIVVAFQPDFVEIREAAILGNVAGRKMTVVVEDGLRRGELMIETPRRLIR